MAGTTNQTCVAGHSVYSTGNGTCQCYAQYYGEYCQYLYEEWAPLSTLNDVAGLCFDLCVLYWAILKLIQLKKDAQFQRNLATTSIFINILALGLQVLSRILGLNGDSHNNQAQTVVYDIINIIIILLPIITWMFATSLIVGFWVELLTKKLTSKFRSYIITLSWVGAALVIVPVIGVLLFLLANQFVAGVLCILVPMFFDFVAIIVIIIVIHRIYIGKGDKLKEKKRYALRIFGILAALWLVIVADLAVVFIALVTVQFFGLWYWLFMLSLTVAMMGVSVCLMFLVDRTARPIKLTRYICLGRSTLSTTSVPGSGTGSGSSGSGVPGSGNQTSTSTGTKTESSGARAIESYTPTE